MPRGRRVFLLSFLTMFVGAFIWKFSHGFGIRTGAHLRFASFVVLIIGAAVYPAAMMVGYLPTE